MWDVSLISADFLDVTVSKSGSWESTGLLQFCCFQKAVNRYLYLPYSTATPRHILSGFIKGELIRYIKRCSAASDFFRMKCLFWMRLRARGYPLAFLRAAFLLAPNYAQRDSLLAVRSPLQSATDTRDHVLILDFSPQLKALNLRTVLYEHRALLPAHLRTQFIVAWRVPTKLAALLVPFRFDRPKPKTIKTIASASVAA